MASLAPFDTTYCLPWSPKAPKHYISSHIQFFWAAAAPSTFPNQTLDNQFDDQLFNTPIRSSSALHCSPVNMSPRELKKAEFAAFSNSGIKIHEVDSDGNCLFNALSHQIHGHAGQHFEIRTKVVAYMREHRNDFIHFVTIDPRRAPTRTARQRNRGPVDNASVTESQHNQIWEKYIKDLAKKGEWADQITISAFVKCFCYDVVVFERGQRSTKYIAPEGQSKGELNITYHSWQHYNSVQTLNGESSGVNKIPTKPITEKASPKAIVEEATTVLPSIEPKDLSSPIRISFSSCSFASTSKSSSPNTPVSSIREPTPKDANRPKTGNKKLCILDTRIAIEDLPPVFDATSSPTDVDFQPPKKRKRLESGADRRARLARMPAELQDEA